MADLQKFILILLPEEAEFIKKNWGNFISYMNKNVNNFYCVGIRDAALKDTDYILRICIRGSASLEELRKVVNKFLNKPETNFPFLTSLFKKESH
jgi:hypothetical protein